MHHVHPEVRHGLMERCAAGVLPRLIASASAAATSARGILDELLDALEDQFHTLAAAVPIQQHKGDA